MKTGGTLIEPSSIFMKFAAALDPLAGHVFKTPDQGNGYNLNRGLRKYIQYSRSPRLNLSAHHYFFKKEIMYQLSSVKSKIT